MQSGWFEAEVLWCDDGKNGDIGLISEAPYPGTFSCRLCNEVGYLDNVFGNKTIVCRPSVRHEVLRAFEKYLLYCGISGCSVFKEAHILFEGDDYVNFESIPGSDLVQCSVSYDGRAMDMGKVSLDVKCESELLEYATDILDIIGW